MKRLKIYISVALGLVSAVVVGQDASFTKSYAMPIKLNPALMGTTNNLYAAAGYRNMWSSIDKAFATYYLTVSSPVLMRPNGQLSAGLAFINDVAGAFHTNDVSASVAYNLKIDRNNQFCAALSGGWVGHSVDNGVLSFDSQYIWGDYGVSNPSGETVLQKTVSYMDAGFGLLWHYHSNTDSVQAWAGVSSLHFQNPSESSLQNGNSSLAARTNIIAGIKFITSSQFDISPAVRACYQGSSSEQSVGLYLDYNLKAKSAAPQSTAMMGTGSSSEPQAAPAPVSKVKLSGALWYNRHSNSVSCMLGGRYKNYGLAYSYDFTSTPVRIAAFRPGGHEITFNYLLPRDKKQSRTPVQVW